MFCNMQIKDKVFIKIDPQGVHVSLARLYRQYVPSHCNRTQTVNSTADFPKSIFLLSLSLS